MNQLREYTYFQSNWGNEDKKNSIHETRSASELHPKTENGPQIFSQQRNHRPRQN